MDWNKISTMIAPYVAKAKEYGKKAAEFAEDQIQTTPLFIKNQQEYDNLLLEKRLVILAYDENHIVADDIRLLSAVWITRAFMDNAKLRFVRITEITDFTRNLGLQGSLDMRVFFEGVQTCRISDIGAMKKWWQSPVYIKDTTSDISHAHVTPVDPLAGNNI